MPPYLHRLQVRSDARPLGQPGMESQLGFDTGISKSLLLTSGRVRSKTTSQVLQFHLHCSLVQWSTMLDLAINGK